MTLEYYCSRISVDSPLPFWPLADFPSEITSFLNLDRLHLISLAILNNQYLALV